MSIADAGFGMFVAGFLTLLLISAYAIWIHLLVPIAGGSGLVALTYVAGLVTLFGLFLIELDPYPH